MLEDTTGVRRVVVTPQSPECYPPSYSPALSPTHHLPPYLPHPHFIPNSHSFYPPVSPGELPPHQYYQHHLPPMYGDPGTCADWTQTIGKKTKQKRKQKQINRRFLRWVKIQLWICATQSAQYGIYNEIFSLLFFLAEIIPVYGMSNFIGREDTYSKPQPKKLKEPRQNRVNSPPSTPYKGSLGPAHNGYRWLSFMRCALRLANSLIVRLLKARCWWFIY